MTQSMKVIHFVTGGFSGATRVAIDLVAYHQQYPDVQCLLVLRQKKTTTADKLQELHDLGLDFQLVTNSSHLASIIQLKAICETYKPDLVVAHGFPEHLIGRWAALWARVPHMIQVEHNSKERYTPFRLWQSRYLSRFSDRLIGVSHGVADVLRKQQLQAPIDAIPNGIDTTRFGGQQCPTLIERPQHIIMVGRFAKSKDQITLVKALNLLKSSGLNPKLTLVGSGSKRYYNQVKSLVDTLQLNEQVEFITHSTQIPQLLSQHQIFVMSSNFEGLNLSVLEAMASGCLTIGSDALGVAELISHNYDGFIFPKGNAQVLAEYLTQVLNHLPDYQAFTHRARLKVMHHYNKNQVYAEYYHQFKHIICEPSGRVI